jgi:hypothetical protein
MKTRFFVVLSLLVAGATQAARLPVDDPPAGRVIEVHSCELFAGGCVVSSQATLQGRNLLRVWEFTGGGHRGVPFKGLAMAVLEQASDNLAQPDALPAEAVVYLPDSASSAQQEALLRWLKEVRPELDRVKPHTRTVAIKGERTTAGEQVSIGDNISVVVRPLERCDTGACGERLWYTPRVPTAFFTVAVNRSSRVHEPLLNLKWEDAAKRSVFCGTFGGTERGVFRNALENDPWCDSAPERWVAGAMPSRTPLTD